MTLAHASTNRETDRCGKVGDPKALPFPAILDIQERGVFPATTKPPSASVAGKFAGL